MCNFAHMLLSIYWLTKSVYLNYNISLLPKKDSTCMVHNHNPTKPKIRPHPKYLIFFFFFFEKENRYRLIKSSDCKWPFS